MLNVRTASRIQADLRLAVAVLKAVALLLALVTGVSAAWLVPFFWLAFAPRLVTDPGFRLVLFLNILLFWTWAQVVTFNDVRAIRSRKRLSPLPGWFVEIPRSTQLWASNLIDVVESRFVRLRWRLRLYLSFVPGIEYRPDPGGPAGTWRMAIGLSTVAFLSMEELTALLVASGLCRLSWMGQPHYFLIGLLRKAERRKSALPPHPGFFSFARCLTEGLVAALQPLPAQLEKWTVHVAGTMFTEGTVRTAFAKSRTAGLLQANYLHFFETSAVNRGLLPPYAEGMWRLYGKTLQGIQAQPAFRTIPGLWVYERRLLESCLGRDRMSELRPANWDDLRENIRPSWDETAAELRTVLDACRVADLPKLVCQWRSLLRRWLLQKQRAPVVTPDRQREVFLFLLGAALGAVLLQAGWQIASCFGEEISLVKDSRTLNPFRLVSALGAGTLSSAQYHQECAEAGIADLWLNAPASSVSATNYCGNSAPR